MTFHNKYISSVVTKLHDKNMFLLNVCITITYNYNSLWVLRIKENTQLSIYAYILKYIFTYVRLRIYVFVKKYFILDRNVLGECRLKKLNIVRKRLLSQLNNTVFTVIAIL